MCYSVERHPSFTFILPGVCKDTPSSLLSARKHFANGMLTIPVRRWRFQVPLHISFGKEG